MVQDPSAALLVRVWLEGPGEFRARLLTLHADAAGTSAEEVTVAVASSPEGVLDAVRAWLDDFTRGPGTGQGQDRSPDPPKRSSLIHDGS